MGKLHRTYKLTIETLSPVHIGTGNTLLRDFDFAVRDGERPGEKITWVIDRERLAEELYDDESPDFEKLVQGSPPTDLLYDDEYKESSPFIRYCLKGEDIGSDEIRELIKDPWHRPYIPGSSLKGAIRTALIYHALGQSGLPSSINDEEIRIRTLAGKDKLANYDLLRALRISDSEPGKQDWMRPYTVAVVSNGKANGITISLEVIKARSEFTGSLVLDEFLIEPKNASDLGWSDHQLELLETISEAVNAFSRKRIEREIQRWQSVEGGNQIAEFYQRRLRDLDQLKPDEFILQVGWGGGWDSKTPGLQEYCSEDEFNHLVRAEKIVHRGKFNSNWHVPKSRRVKVDDENKPAQPLGWIKVHMEREK